jgi:hypothetical protein
MRALRLVGIEECPTVNTGGTEAQLRSEAALRAEAVAIEAWHGKNPYSDFLFKYCRRPDPNQAATMGRLIGARVRASDGTMQPPLSATERRLTRAERMRYRAKADIDSQVARLCRAIAGLAENDAPPAEIMGHVRPDLDEPIIRKQLSRAVLWLSRFEEEWRRRETGRTD